MTTCDILVVGGGPAGSTCAGQLVRAGFDVIVLDKSRFPRDKTCAGWVTPQVVETLGLDVEDYRRTRTLQPITGFLTGVVGRRPLATRYGRLVSYGIRRCEFDHYLLERCGARLRLGEAVETLERRAGRWVVNGSISAAMLVGAGGHFCPVARALGARLGRDEPVISAQEAEFELGDGVPCGVDAAQPELYFCEDLRGYGWCFRKGRYLNVGLGREGNRGLAADVRAFWDWLAECGKVPRDARPRLKGHAYLLHGRGARPLVEAAALLIGDAAGLAYPQSGEGIRPAVESGLMAAQVIRQAGGDYARQRLLPYRAALEHRFGPMSPARPGAALLPDRWRLSLGRGLLSVPWFARHVVIDRWFLHAKEPALAPSSGGFA